MISEKETSQVLRSDPEPGMCNTAQLGLETADKAFTKDMQRLLVWQVRSTAAGGMLPLFLITACGVVAELCMLGQQGLSSSAGQLGIPPCPPVLRSRSVLPSGYTVGVHSCKSHHQSPARVRCFSRNGAAPCQRLRLQPQTWVAQKQAPSKNQAAPALLCDTMACNAVLDGETAVAA